MRRTPKNGSESVIQALGANVLANPLGFFIDGIHYNKKIERAILGLCLADINATSMVSGMIEVKHFYVTENKLVAEAILQVNGRGTPVDTFSVLHELMSNGIQEIGDKPVAYHLSCLTNGVTSNVGVVGYAHIVVNLWKHRRVIELTSRQHIVGEDPTEILEEVEKTVAEIRQSSGAVSVDAPDGIMQVMEDKDSVRDGSMRGITTGLNSMDAATGGFENGCLYIIAARPSVGKTALMGRCVIGAAKTGKHVGIIQLEMSVKQTYSRMMALYGDMTYYEVVSGFTDEEERARFYRIMGGMGDLPLHVNPAGNINIEGIKSWAHTQRFAGKLDILFVDYLQLVESTGGRSREQDVSAISRGLKTLARTLDIPVVALSQLNRAIETRVNRRPVLSDLRESGAIEQDADAVYFVHRDHAMGIEFDADGNSTINEAELIFAKNRNGARGTLPLKYDGPKMKFYEEIRSWTPVR